MLQAPPSDAMTHAGQMPMLRGLCGDPVEPENFIDAKVSPSSLTSAQAEPIGPDAELPKLRLIRIKPSSSVNIATDPYDL